VRAAIGHVYTRQRFRYVRPDLAGCRLAVEIRRVDHRRHAGHGPDRARFLGMRLRGAGRIRARRSRIRAARNLRGKQRDEYHSPHGWAPQHSSCGF
jgi:hypothetical protein